MRSKLPGLRRTHFAVSERANGQACNTRGIHNFVAKLKEARHGSTNVEKGLEAGLREFCTRKVNTATI
ncbi:hypothetical protein PC113_g10907 [Phytophthora cactorum]|uniref:Uncharacterized protein n=1 Tax=Phytophthora cactorum TaxID=29920 RepID=A0A8T0Z4K3_9STRA|nr:hypothetical protein PC113_g10907 [Phytophthora cactorum]KAG3060884.1 hypothetical protein PC121_g13248 [Phytophthora cactorum]KAG4036629.1 hypothetical protein PC123_g27802 [Phytophthora cactorum]